MINLLIFVLFFIAISLLLSPPNCIAEEISYWVTHGTTRVTPDEIPKGGSEASIKAARNEYEPFQLIVRSQDNIKNVDVTVSDLAGSNGAKIGKENIVLFREHYVYVRVPSLRCDNAPGWYPDALIPFIEAPKDTRFVASPFDMWKGMNEVIWADVFVPKDAFPGDYSGSLTVTADGKELLKVPINLTVWDFVLPDIPSMMADFGGYGGAASWHGLKPDSQEFRQIEMQYCKTMAEHRICPLIPSYLHPKPNPDGSISTDETHAQLKEFIETMHVNSFRIQFGTGYPYPDPLGKDRDRTISYLRNLYDYLNENGWADMAYTYAIDEPNDAKAYDEVREFAKLLHEAHSELKFLCTEQTLTQDPAWGDFNGYVDIWVPLWPLHDESTAKDRLDAGDELWSYTALCQGGKPSPFWQLDFPVLNYRIPMWGSWIYQMTGLLYWSVVFWNQVKDPWLDQLTIYGHYNGDGSLLYPGKDAGIDGPVTSIRLKNIREGMEDYEYFKILESLGDKDFADNQARKVIQSWFSWEEDPARLMGIREQMADRIVSLKKR